MCKSPKMPDVPKVAEAPVAPNVAAQQDSHRKRGRQAAMGTLLTGPGGTGTAASTGGGGGTLLGRA